MLATASTIANAIYDAIGICLFDPLDCGEGLRGPSQEKGQLKSKESSVIFYLVIIPQNPELDISLSFKAMKTNAD
ncbi:hypothetical protein CL673_05605 [Candidatus Bathyarchaeota archaeon]|nr:hypothetical protein [Candidatus Bathyarchaeota archaeon]